MLLNRAQACEALSVSDFELVVLIAECVVVPRFGSAAGMFDADMLPSRERADNWLIRVGRRSAQLVLPEVSDGA